MSILPIGLRNNNPGNIRVSKTKFRGEIASDNGFKKFDSMVNGYRAMFLLLRNYNRYHGINTIRGIVNRYAPSCENNTQAYIDFVCSSTNIGPDVPIDFTKEYVLICIVCSMAYIETGYKPDVSQVVAGYKASL